MMLLLFSRLFPAGCREDCVGSVYLPTNTAHSASAIARLQLVYFKMQFTKLKWEQLTGSGQSHRVWSQVYSAIDYLRHRITAQVKRWLGATDITLLWLRPQPVTKSPFSPTHMFPLFRWWKMMDRILHTKPSQARLRPIQMILRVFVLQLLWSHNTYLKTTGLKARLSILFTFLLLKICSNRGWCKRFGGGNVKNAQFLQDNRGEIKTKRRHPFRATTVDRTWG